MMEELINDDDLNDDSFDPRGHSSKLSSMVDSASRDLFAASSSLSSPTSSSLNSRPPPLQLLPISDTNESGIFNDCSRIAQLEHEQEHLSSSLMSLTTHFAQVQFRLKQIVNAPSDNKDQLLKELEEFAFRGCPNLSVPSDIIEEQRAKQKELIEQLRQQLEDLETYAYQSGELEIPSSVVMEKHKLILEELKDKINLPVEDLNKLSNDELKKVINSKVGEIVNPMKVKEQLVSQLKTQIEDLERFINFLQGEATSPGPYLAKMKKCDNCSSEIDDSKGASGGFAFSFNQSTKSKTDSTKRNARGVDHENIANNQSTIELLKKVLSVMQIYAISQLGCGINPYDKNTLKKTSNHWGDLRANLELSINKVMRVHASLMETLRINKLKLSSATTESDDEMVECPHELIRAVRKDLACALRDLLQHGLIETSHGTSMVPFGCFVVRSKNNQSQLHAWDLLIKYFEMKHGKEYIQSATNKLSQSFALQVVSGKSITIKQSLLNAIDTVYKVHKYDISNKDSCFKAFVCLAINEKKLPVYLKQILKTSLIVENYYQTWSYVKMTGFDDALKSLDQLKTLNSNFPVEKSIRRKASQKELF